ncbi:MAG: 5'-methylthioadenosine/adenosylhomocysteine nucleosidase [Muribaculaceae bacterium]|nr:5'-methylthioadenosine/adenosylhomocysteine nucleosidase [Muribaculaceae bacterium]
MKIGILAAMDKEVSLLLPLLEDKMKTEFDGRKAYVGSIGDNQICVMKCGIGKVNSALNAFRMIEGFKPDLVINSGVAGGADASMPVGTLLIATEAAYHDVWCGPGTEWGQIDGMPRRFPMDASLLEKCSVLTGLVEARYGLICSGDRFISKAEEVDFIKSEFPDVLACDMESASIAQACRDKGVPFAVVRVVSDTPGQADNISQYQDFWTIAPEKTFHAVKTIVNSIK